MARIATRDVLDHPDAAIDKIVARCSGDLRGAVRALLLVNEHLERELNRVHKATVFASQAKHRGRRALH